MERESDQHRLLHEVSYNRCRVTVKAIPILSRSYLPVFSVDADKISHITLSLHLKCFVSLQAKTIFSEIFLGFSCSFA